jgi:hypothetical protein
MMNVFYYGNGGGVAVQIDHWGKGARSHAAARILGMRMNGYHVRTIEKGKAWSCIKFRDVPYSGYLRIGDDEEVAAYRWSEKHAAALRASAREREATIR